MCWSLVLCNQYRYRCTCTCVCCAIPGTHLQRPNPTPLFRAQRAGKKTQNARQRRQRARKRKEGREEARKSREERAATQTKRPPSRPSRPSAKLRAKRGKPRKDVKQHRADGNTSFSVFKCGQSKRATNTDHHHHYQHHDHYHHHNNINCHDSLDWPTKYRMPVSAIYLQCVRASKDCARELTPINYVFQYHHRTTENQSSGTGTACRTYLCP